MEYPHNIHNDHFDHPHHDHPHDIGHVDRKDLLDKILTETGKSRVRIPGPEISDLENRFIPEGELHNTDTAVYDPHEYFYNKYINRRNTNSSIYCKEYNIKCPIIRDLGNRIIYYYHGPYSRLKADNTKDKNTLYFGYDNSDHLVGIFVGNDEITPTVRDASVFKQMFDPSQNIYFDRIQFLTSDLSTNNWNYFNLDVPNLAYVSLVFESVNNAFLEVDRDLLSKLLKDSELNLLIQNVSTNLRNKENSLLSKIDEANGNSKTYYEILLNSLSLLNKNLTNFINSSVNNLKNSLTSMLNSNMGTLNSSIRNINSSIIGLKSMDETILNKISQEHNYVVQQVLSIDRHINSSYMETNNNISQKLNELDLSLNNTFFKNLNKINSSLNSIEKSIRDLKTDFTESLSLTRDTINSSISRLFNTDLLLQNKHNSDKNLIDASIVDIKNSISSHLIHSDALYDSNYLRIQLLKTRLDNLDLRISDDVLLNVSSQVNSYMESTVNASLNDLHEFIDNGLRLANSNLVRSVEVLNNLIDTSIMYVNATIANNYQNLNRLIYLNNSNIEALRLINLTQDTSISLIEQELSRSYEELNSKINDLIEEVSNTVLNSYAKASNTLNSSLNLMNLRLDILLSDVDYHLLKTKNIVDASIKELLREFGDYKVIVDGDLDIFNTRILTLTNLIDIYKKNFDLRLANIATSYQVAMLQDEYETYTSNLQDKYDKLLKRVKELETLHGIVIDDETSEDITPDDPDIPIVDPSTDVPPVEPIEDPVDVSTDEPIDTSI